MKKMIQLAMMACFALTCVSFASCSDDTIVESSQENENFQPFRLTASQETPSRLALGQDGLTVTWEPNDQLMLVKKDRSIVPICMNAELDAPSTSATFVSEVGVPSGDYYVIYNYNDNLAYSHHGFSSIEDINNNNKLVLWGELTVTENMTEASIALQHLYAKVRVELQNMPSEHANYHIGMYASRSGFPIYKQFTQNGLINADNGRYFTSLSSYENGFHASDRKYHNIRFGRCYIWTWPDENGETAGSNKSEVEQNSALILPADVSNGTVYFYILDGNDCYEIPKSNLKFEQGKSYKVILDMNNATKTTLKSVDITLPGNSYSETFYQLSSPEDCRHAAYRGHGNYILMDDIDFENNNYLPIMANRIDGNGHTIKNITIDWGTEDYVGLFIYDYYKNNGYDENQNFETKYTPFSSACMVSKLTIENATINGNDFVGALGGTYINADNCNLKSTVINGTGNYVGGLVGYNEIYNEFNGGYFSISNSSTDETCHIKGDNFVGGFVGGYSSMASDYIYLYSSSKLLNSCASAATIEATGNYAGGIFGSIGNYSNVNFSSEDYTLSLYGCVNTGKVKGKDYVGGIGGAFNLSCNSSVEDKVIILQSANEGDIEGANYVGGIVGTYQSSINLCYSIGNYSASGTNLGGIVGEYNGGGHSLNLTNCYSIANLSVGAGGYDGGIFGSMSTYMGALNIENCYFAGSSSTNSGIIGHNGGLTNISNCLTTLSSLGDTNPPFMDVEGDGISEVITNTTNSLTSVTSILQNKTVINGDNAYSDAVWTNYSYDCVKFAAGLSGSVVAPGFGTEIIY